MDCGMCSQLKNIPNRYKLNSRTGVAEVVKLSRMGLGQAEQLYTLILNMYGCLYSTVQLSGDSLASVEVSLTLLEKFGTDKQINRQIHSGAFRVASATKNESLAQIYS